MSGDSKRPFRARVAAYLVACLLLNPALPPAIGQQAAPPSITGRVVDGANAGLPGVAVIVTHADTGRQVAVECNSAGEFSLQGLLPGRYTVRTIMPGFRSFAIEVIVTEGQTTRVPITLTADVMTITVGEPSKNGSTSPAPPPRRDSAQAVAVVPPIPTEVQRKCDRLAGSALDPDRAAPGVAFNDINKTEALAACKPAAEAPRAHRRYLFQYARALQASGNGAEAIRWYTRAVEAGSVVSAHALGGLYFAGPPQDDALAMRWYRRAAESGLPDSMFAVGYLYHYGRGGASNPAEAARWYQRAADAGSAEAMTNLGILYAAGQGVPQSDATALGWFSRAADAGNVHALTRLGYVYAEGRGVARDPQRAATLWLQARARGEEFAALAWADAAAEGVGVPKDIAAARAEFDRLRASRDERVRTYAASRVQALDSTRSAATAPAATRRTDTTSAAAETGGGSEVWWMLGAAAALAILFGGGTSNTSSSGSNVDNEEYLNSLERDARARAQSSCLLRNGMWMTTGPDGRGFCAK